MGPGVASGVILGVAAPSWEPYRIRLFEHANYNISVAYSAGDGPMQVGSAVADTGSGVSDRWQFGFLITETLGD